MPRLCYLPACLVPAFYQCSYPENPHRRHNNQYPCKDIVPGKSISDSRRSTHKRHCDTKNHTIHSDIFFSDQTLPAGILIRDATSFRLFGILLDQPGTP